MFVLDVEFTVVLNMEDMPYNGTHNKTAHAHELMVGLQSELETAVYNGSFMEEWTEEASALDVDLAGVALDMEKSMDSLSTFSR